jgi:nitrogen fixation NifU-like protein
MEFDDLYQEIILDHYRHPRHAGDVPEEELLVEEENPTCGDQIRLTAMVKDGTVMDIKYEARGCAISMASASMMSEDLIGKPIDAVRGRIRTFVKLMRGEGESMPDEPGDLIALEGVKQFPMRIKCATMCWHAADQALDKLTGGTGPCAMSG